MNITGRPFRTTFAINLASCAASISLSALAAPSVCQLTNNLVLRACQFETRDDLLIEKANCINASDQTERKACLAELAESQAEATELCDEQAAARALLCDMLGENQYDPSEFWQPENFVDPLEIGGSVAPNPYFPLLEGTKVLENEDEVITITITQETKLVNGVTCLTVNDLVTEDGLNVEDTDDWYAQDIYGNVWYCGEISKNYEFYPGDNPEAAELVDVDGSWKAFRDGALPGYQMLAAPAIGTMYRQEMLLGDAEDAAEIITATADGIIEGDLCLEDDAEIREIIDELCDDDCLVTREFTPVEPDVSEHKYYAPGIGNILATNPAGECTVIDLD